MITTRLPKLYVPYYNFKRKLKLTDAWFYSTYFSVYKAGVEFSKDNLRYKSYFDCNLKYQEDFKGLPFLCYKGVFYYIGDYFYLDLEYEYRENIYDFLGQFSNIDLLQILNKIYQKHYNREPFIIHIDLNLQRKRGLKNGGIKFKGDTKFGGLNFKRGDKNGGLNLEGGEIFPNLFFRKTDIILKEISGIQRVIDFTPLAPDFYLLNYYGKLV